MSPETVKSIESALAGSTAWWIFSSAIATMPQPQPMERWYSWLFQFLQRVGANHALLQAPPEKLVVLSDTDKK